MLRRKGGLFIVITQWLLNYVSVARLSLTDCLAANRYEKDAVISEHHTHIDSFEVLQDLPGLLSRGTSATLHNTVVANHR